MSTTYWQASVTTGFSASASIFWPGKKIFVLARREEVRYGSSDAANRVLQLLLSLACLQLLVQVALCYLGVLYLIHTHHGFALPYWQRLVIDILQFIVTLELDRAV